MDMNPVLYMSGPYPGHREISLEEIVGVAEFYRAQAADAGWLPICPSLWPEAEPWRSGEALIQRLDPDYDAMLMLPGWLRDQHAIVDRQRAVARGLKIYAARDGHPIPSVEAHQLCPHYRVVHYEISDRDTCDANVSRCPVGANCPLRKKVWRGRAR